MISERRGGSKKENDIAKWEGKIRKSHILSKLFTWVVKYLTIRNNEYNLN